MAFKVRHFGLPNFYFSTFSPYDIQNLVTYNSGRGHNAVLIYKAYYYFQWLSLFLGLLGEVYKQAMN